MIRQLAEEPPDVPSGAAGQLSLQNVVLFVICLLAERQLHIPTCWQQYFIQAIQ